jgi:DtxR family transcriptional regulator, Mn-dependent transcriptional regulator
MNRAEEDYIKTIYELTIEKNVSIIKSIDLVERFNYTDQSVNEMVKKLGNKGLVNFVPYKGISLTPKGKKVAIRMVRAHRIWELFLTTKLGYSWESVHEDAEKLEHVASDEIIEKLYKFLGEPKYCQHGNPIPNLEGHLEITDTLRLYDVKVNQTFEVTRVIDNKELLVYLNYNEVKLHDVVTVTNKDEFNDIVRIKNNNKEIIMSAKTTKMIFGKIV